MIDLDRGELAVDATLYDSRILAYILTGDMALRARWGTDPSCLCWRWAASTPPFGLLHSFPGSSAPRSP